MNNQTLKCFLQHFQHRDRNQDRIYQSKENEQIYLKNIVIKKTKIERFDHQKSNQDHIFQKLKNTNKYHLLPLYHVWQNNSHRFVAMPHYQENVQSYLKRNWDELRKNPHIICSIILQILYGLVELQIQGIYHRDLKLSNMLIKELQNNQVQVVLSDFQSCNKGFRINQSVIGTQLYMAPEMKLGNSYDSKVDIWSLVLAIFELFAVLETKAKENKRFPQLDKDYQNNFFRIEKYSPEKFEQFKSFIDNNRPIISKQVPEVFREIMRKAFVLQPQKRWSLEQILEYLNEKFDSLLSLFPESIKASVQNQFTIYFKLISQQKKSKQQQQISKLQHKFQFYQKYFGFQNRNRDQLKRYKSYMLIIYCMINSILRTYQKLDKDKVAKQGVLQKLLLKNQYHKKQKNIQYLYEQRKIVETKLKQQDVNIEAQYQKFLLNPEDLIQKNLIKKSLTIQQQTGIKLFCQRYD